MLISLKNLALGEKRFSVVLKKSDIGIADYEKEFELVSDVNTDIVLSKTKKNVELSVHLKYKLRLQCSRCLDFFIKEFDEHEMLVLRQGQEHVHMEGQMHDEDIYTYFYADDEVDISPFVRDVIILSVPLKPLCKPDCKGLCPVCGANLNRETCEHTGKVKYDTRMSKLLDIKNMINKKR